MLSNRRVRNNNLWGIQSNSICCTVGLWCLNYKMAKGIYHRDLSQLACIWTRGNPSALSFYGEVHTLPTLHTSACVPVGHSTDQTLITADGKGVHFCFVLFCFLVITIEVHFLGSSEFYIGPLLIRSIVLEFIIRANLESHGDRSEAIFFGPVNLINLRPFLKPPGCPEPPCAFLPRSSDEG